MITGALTHTPANVIQQLLVDLSLASQPAINGVVQDDDWPCYFNYLPDSISRAIVCYDTDGRIHGREMVEGVVQEHFGIQVRVQAELAGHTAAQSKMRSICTNFAEEVLRNTVTIDGTSYLVQAITRTSGPISLGISPTNRHRLFTANFLVSLRMT